MLLLDLANRISNCSNDGNPTQPGSIIGWGNPISPRHGLKITCVKPNINKAGLTMTHRLSIIFTMTASIYLILVREY